MHQVECVLKICVHKFWVLAKIFKFCGILMWRGIVHDLSKCSANEFHRFADTIQKLKGSTYGSPEYKMLLKELGPALAHHYKVNSHHPEYYQGGVNDMTLYDFIEMYFDWEAAVKKHADGSVLDSLVINKKRFRLSPQIHKILKKEL